MSNEETNQRVALIDQLLALSPGEAGAHALQNARGDAHVWRSGTRWSRI